MGADSLLIVQQFKIMQKSKKLTLREKVYSLNQSGSLALMLGAGDFCWLRSS
jgi:hypothetical protein